MFEHFAIQHMPGTKDRVEVICKTCKKHIASTGYGAFKEMSLGDVNKLAFVHMSDSHPDQAGIFAESSHV